MSSYGDHSPSFSAIVGDLCWSCRSPKRDGADRPREIIPENPAACDSNPLRQCGQCKRVSYCTKTCQTDDWKNHKKLCKVYQKLNDSIREEPTTFPDKFTNEVLSHMSWMFLQAQRLALFTRLTGLNQNHPAATRIVCYAPKCFFCLRSQFHPGIHLKACSGCHVVFACKSHRHLLGRSEGHTAEKCRQWAELAYMDVIMRDHVERSRKSRDGVPEPGVLLAHDRILTIYPGLPQGWHKYFEWRQNAVFQTLKDEERRRHDVRFRSAFPKDHQRLLLAASTQSFSMILSILAGLEKVYTIQQLNQLSTLTIHVIYATEGETLKFRVFEEIIHVLPAIKQLRILVIGKEPMATNMPWANRPTDLRNCSNCLAADRKRTLQSVPMTYQAFASHPSFSLPDIAVAFNTGMYESSEMWKPTITKLISLEVPVLITGFNAEDASEDQALVRAWGGRIISKCKKNKWSSLVAIPEQFILDEFYCHNGWWFMFEGKAQS